jgi:competence protein ComEC
MSENLQNSFNNSWLTHLVAVSWFNITIIIIFLWFLFSFFPLILRTFLICLFVVIFVLVVWDNVPVIRAGIMWLIGYFILVSWRKSDSLSLLLFTAFVLVIYNPLYLNYDVSFHLSFLAVLGLLYFQEFWWKIFKFLPSFFAVKESFVLTMSALTTTLPIMIFNFGQVSILAPISNMLVGWVIPFAMLFWFLSILWEIIWYKIGFIIWFVNYFLLKYVILIAEYFWNLEFAVFKINFWIFGVYLEILYFMLLIFWIIYFKQEKSPKL